jgi:hypothetical protein
MKTIKNLKNLKERKNNMAPRHKLPSDSPAGKDIKRIVRKMLTEELTIMAYNNSDETISLQLMLDGVEIGNLLNLDIDFKTDHGHGGGSYANGLLVKVIDDEMMKRGRRGE